jgi:hypothetical protein
LAGLSNWGAEGGDQQPAEKVLEAEVSVSEKKELVEGERKKVKIKNNNNNFLNRRFIFFLLFFD